MNIILFESHEIGKPLPRRDERTIHLLKVLKKKPGEFFEAGILNGNRGTGLIESIRLDGSVFYSLDLKNEPPARYPLRMAIGFPRPIQLRRILRELSNFGILAIDLMGTELGEKSYRDTKLLSDGGSYTALVEGAAQSRDTLLPELTVYDSLDKWLKQHPWEVTETQTVFTKVPLLIAMDNVRAEGSIFHLSPSNRQTVIAIGPERGWSDRERDLFEKAGFLRLSMGDRALRTETACVAAAMLAIEKTGVTQ